MNKVKNNTLIAIWVLCVFAVALFWGHYGIFAKISGLNFDHRPELTFIWVCLVYLGLGVPLSLWLIDKEPETVFPDSSRKFSIGAGICGALGALCVIIAMKTAEPIFVMPLVFGPAQLFNFLFSWKFQGIKNKPETPFYGGLVGIIIFSWALQQFKGGATLETLGNFEPGMWMLWTTGAAMCWGLYGVCVKLAVMKSAKASGGHGSHGKPLFYVSLVYGVFGVLTYALGYTPFFEQITYNDLTGSKIGLLFGVLTGVAGLGGAAFVIPANGVKDSPGPIVVMAWVFLLASVVNVFSSMVFDKFFFKKEVLVSLPFVVAFLGLAISAFIFQKYNPIRPPAKKPAH